MYIFSINTHFSGNQILHDLLDKVALKFGSVAPFLGHVAQMLQLAKFVAEILDKGSKCSNFGGIAIFIMLTVMVGILAVEVAVMLAAPITAFFVGIAFDFFFDWLLAEATRPGGQCGQGSSSLPS